MNLFISAHARMFARAALVGLAGLACSEPFSPRSLAGVYALVALNDAPPPLTLAPSFVVIADSLQLDVDGRGTWTSVRDTTPTGAAPLPLARQVRPVRVARRDGATWLDLTCEGLNDCVPGVGYPFAAVGDEIIIDVDPAVLRFRRVAP